MKPISLAGLSPETILNYPKPGPMETPGLQKAQKVLNMTDEHDQFAKTSSLTPHIDAFFEKLAEDSKTDAQKRYPELMKVSVAGSIKTVAPARKVPGTNAGSATSTVPVQTMMSGGAA
jgi:hypothetical protein